MPTQHTTPTVLTIAGSDSCGGAGIQADLKTLAALHVYGTCAITALTAQNTCSVEGIFAISPEFVQLQIQTVLSDIQVSAIKTGMLVNSAMITAVVQALAKWQHIPLVVDPVMIATSGASLLDDDAVLLLRSQLLPQASVITPNIPEAATLLGLPQATCENAMIEQAKQLLALGPTAVLLKGGHGTGPSANDIFCDARGVHILKAVRISTRNTHGTGCTLASAIAAGLAKGLEPQDACIQAKRYLHRALAHKNPLHVGCGQGPIQHFFSSSI